MGKKKTEINREMFDLDNQVYRQETETHAVFVIGKNEKVEMAQEAGQLQADAFEIEDSVKRFKKEKDDQVKGLRSEVQKLLTKIHLGEEERKVSCLAEYDYIGFKIRFVNLKTGEIIKEKDMDEFTMNNKPGELEPGPSSETFENNPQIADGGEAPVIDGTKGPEVSKIVETVDQVVEAVEAARQPEPVPTPAVEVAPTIAPVQVAPVAPQVPVPQPVAGNELGSFENAFSQ